MMLGRKAGQMFWLGRQMERAENMARHVEVAYRLALTPRMGEGYHEQWASTLETTGTVDAYRSKHDAVGARRVVHFLLFDRDNRASIMSSIDQARDNARSVRTSITREVWTAINETWIAAQEHPRDDFRLRHVPALLEWVKQRSEQFRGAMLGTQLRNDAFYFAEAGTYLERADNTARLLDTKYFELLPEGEDVGGEVDTYQWYAMLRAVSAHRSYKWSFREPIRPVRVAEFMILHREMPRSLRHSWRQLATALYDLADIYNAPSDAADRARRVHEGLKRADMNRIFADGLHEYLEDMIVRTNALSGDIARTYNF